MKVKVTLRDGRIVTESKPSTPWMTARLQEAISQGRDWEEFGFGEVGNPVSFTAGDVQSVEVSR